MCLILDRTVTRVLYEGITNYNSLSDFDKDSLKELLRNCYTSIQAIVEDLAAEIAAD